MRGLLESRPAIEVLSGLGYRQGVHRPDEAHYFIKPPTDHWWEGTHHLHLTPPTSLLWRRRIAFRDALRRRPDDRARHERLKRDLAAAHGADIAAYARRKDDFVNEVLGVADTTQVLRDGQG